MNISAKKEEELIVKIGIETSKYKDGSSETSAATKRLADVTKELEQTKIQLNMMTEELQEQETSLKHALMEAEKEASENWIAARKAERRVIELQKDMSNMRNKLTAIEGKKDVSNQLINQNPVPSLLPPLPGLPASLTSLIPPTLPSLPGLPLGPLIPGMALGHNSSLNDLSNISFASRRTQSMSSISPAPRDGSYHCHDRNQYKDKVDRYDHDFKNCIRTRSPSPSHESTRSEKCRNSTLREKYPSVGSVSDRDQYKNKIQDRYGSSSDIFSPPETSTYGSTYGQEYSYSDVRTAYSVRGHGHRQVDGWKGRI